jgi:hypothetical protein
MIGAHLRQSGRSSVIIQSPHALHDFPPTNFIIPASDKFVLQVPRRQCSNLGGETLSLAAGGIIRGLCPTSSVGYCPSIPSSYFKDKIKM